MNTFTFIWATEQDVKQIHEIISDVFDTFVGHLYRDEGKKEFKKYIEIPALTNRLKNDHVMLLCRDKEKIAGLIEIRNYNHISLLFVESAYQRKGIARELVNRTIQICTEHNPNLSTITVHASPNSVEAYSKLGFETMQEEQETHGIRFTPMRLFVNSATQ